MVRFGNLVRIGENNSFNVSVIVNRGTDYLRLGTDYESIGEDLDVCLWLAQNVIDLQDPLTSIKEFLKEFGEDGDNISARDVCNLFLNTTPLPHLYSSGISISLVRVIQFRGDSVVNSYSYEDPYKKQAKAVVLYLKNSL